METQHNRRGNPSKSYNTYNFYVPNPASKYTRQNLTELQNTRHFTKIVIVRYFNTTISMIYRSSEQKKQQVYVRFDPHNEQT